VNSLINYKSSGDSSNPCIIIVHGLFGSLDNWQSLAKKWSDKYFVISVDVRNHGKSFHSEDMSFDSLANDIKNLCKNLQINKFHLLGHSMGGKIAMEFASQYPEFLFSLIVVDVAPYAYPPHHGKVFEMLRSLDLKKFSSRLEIETEVRKQINEEDVIQFMLKNIKRNEIELFFEWKFNATVLDRDYLYLIQYIPKKGFNGRTLFIGGDQSNYISKESSIHIFDLYPNAELEYVTNAGHWVHADNPEEFYTKVSLFLNEINN
jgi:pimeloyl-ACP methyl ester carboxylesterase